MISLFNQDCMEAMKEMPDKAYDLAIVDPPYGIGEDGGKDRRGPSKHKRKGWDSAIPERDYFLQLYRVSKNQIIFGANYFPMFLQPSMGWVCWDKKLENSDFSDFELAWTSFQRAAKIFHYAKNGGSRTPAALADIIHPCQKPVRLYEWLLKHYAKPGDRILDTHGGSGSICIACDILGFDLDFYEIDTEYFTAAKERLERHRMQTVIPL